MSTQSCERCGGAGHISAYSHVSGGVCFECNGTGRTEAGHVYQHQGARVEYGVMSGPVRKSKAVTIPGLGAGEMSTYDGCRFVFSRSSCPFGSGCHFTVESGRVCGVELENGMIEDGYKVAAVRAALQSALRC
jgi:hypothetical protein